MTMGDNVATISPNLIRPYISYIFLRCTSGNLEAAFGQLTNFMRRPRNRAEYSKTTILRSGFGNVSTYLRQDIGSHGVDQIDGFIYRLESNPSWAMPGPEFMDSRHILNVALRRNNIVAVYCESSLRDAIGRWFVRDPRPPFTRVSADIVQGAFLRGEAKGLWLRGTHVRSASRPDTKHITGINVEEALNPLEDSSFAMGAARSKLPDDPTRVALLGTVGTTPRKGALWNRQAQDFDEFVKAAIEALELIEETVSRGTPLDRPFPVLAVESHDLSGVQGAYDILTLAPEELAVGPDISDDMLEAADTLQRATFNVIGSPTTADFKLEVGLDGSMSGVLQATVRLNNEVVCFNFGYAEEPTNPSPVRQILDALNYDDLFHIYYDSGHVIGSHGIWSRNINSAPFNNWQFLDFSGFDICVEKPGKTPADIHANAGAATDNSLFGWVVRHYSPGWLICDDGPGEVADFVHLSHESVLSMIHVKAAHSSSLSRNISVGAYEVVASQAAKNGRYLIDLNSLHGSILANDNPGHASWVDGHRVSDRIEFLGMLGCLMPEDKRQVVIVQPHVCETTYKMVRAGDGASGNRPRDLLRLNSLETLLHTTRGAVVALGADLRVIGSKQ